MDCSGIRDDEPKICQDMFHQTLWNIGLQLQATLVNVGGDLGKHGQLGEVTSLN